MIQKLMSFVAYVLAHKADLATDFFAIVGALKVLFHYTPWETPVDKALDKVGDVVSSLSGSKPQPPSAS